MTTLPETPADEYEKKLKVRRGDVRQVLDGLLVAFVALHAIALVSGAVAIFAESDAGLLISPLLWVCSAAVASLPAYVTLRNSHCLQWPIIALGVSPWTVIATETALALWLIAAASKPCLSFFPW